MLISDRVDALRPKLTLVLAHGFATIKNVDERFAYIDRHVLAGVEGAANMHYAVAEVFCDILDIAHPWSKKDEMVCAVLRRLHKSPEKEPSVGDCVNALLSTNEILSMAGVAPDTDEFGESTSKGVQACYAAQRRRVALREMR